MFKDCLPEIIFVPFLNNLSRLFQRIHLYHCFEKQVNAQSSRTEI